MENVPLMIRDYNLILKRRIQTVVEKALFFSGPTVLPMKVIGHHWFAEEVETCLPYRDVVTIGDRQRLKHCRKAIIDREWFVGIWIWHRPVCGFSFLVLEGLGHPDQTHRMNSLILLCII
jgi:hypothetical protein